MKNSYAVIIVSMILIFMPLNSCTGTVVKEKERLSCCIDYSLTDSERESLIGRADTGDPIASYRLAKYYLGYRHASDEGYRWLGKAAEYGSTLAMSDLAEIALRKKDYELSLSWYFRSLKMREAGDTMEKIAQIYETSSQKDMEKARYWYERAARKGITGAIRKMVEFCSEGKGGEKNSKQAYVWWLLVAKREKYPAGFVEAKKKVTIQLNQLSISDIEDAEKESEILLNQIK